MHYVSFSAHSDFLQTSDFVGTLKPSNIVLVHGELNEMMRLKGALHQRFNQTSSTHKMTISAPRNTQPVRLKFQPAKMASAVGGLARVPREHGAELAGLLVRDNFSHSIVTPAELDNHTPLHKSTITQRQLIPYAGRGETVRHYLQQMFTSAADLPPVAGDAANTLRMQLHGALAVSHVPGQHHVVLEWEADALNDMLADVVLACLLSVEANPNSMKLLTPTPPGHVHTHGSGGGGSPADMLPKLGEYLQQYFVDVGSDAEGRVAFVHNGMAVSVDGSLDVAVEVEAAEPAEAPSSAMDIDGVESQASSIAAADSQMSQMSSQGGAAEEEGTEADPRASEAADLKERIEGILDKFQATYMSVL